MSTASPIPSPPAGFVLRRTPDAICVAAEPLAEAVDALRPCEPGALARLLAGARGGEGRGPTALVRLPDAHADRALHLRPWRPGGLLARLRSAALPDLRRPFDELRVTAALAAAGAPVPVPVLVLAQRRGRRWEACVGTLFEVGSVDARAFLAERPDRARVLRAASAAGRALRRFHDAGGRHADLHLGNLLVCERDDDTRVIVVDLDRADLARVEPARRMREVMRLHRSLVKHAAHDLVGPRGYARFWSSYTAGDRALGVAMRARLGREKLRVALHRVSYPLRRTPALGRSRR